MKERPLSGSLSSTISVCICIYPLEINSSWCNWEQ